MLEKTLESPLDCKEIQPVHSEGDQSWVFFGRTDAKAETPIFWPPHAKCWLIGKDWCWEGLGAGGEGDNRGWDGQMASLTWWTWVWVNSGSWWWTGRPGVLQYMGSQKVRHNWATELNSTELNMLDGYIVLLSFGQDYFFKSTFINRISGVSQFISTLPSPLVATPLVSRSVALFLLCKQDHLYHFFQIPLLSINIRHLLFSFWLTSLCMK